MSAKKPKKVAKKRVFKPTDSLRNLSKRQRELVKALRAEKIETYEVTGNVTKAKIEDVTWDTSYYDKRYEDRLNIDNELTEQFQESEDEYPNKLDITLSHVSEVIGSLQSDVDPHREELGNWLADKWSKIMELDSEVRKQTLEENGDEICSILDDCQRIGYLGNEVRSRWATIEEIMHYIPSTLEERISANERYSTEGELT